MKKRTVSFFAIWLMAVLLIGIVPNFNVMAAEQQNAEDTEQDTSEETEYPESYYLPVESDEIEGWPSGPQIEGEAAVVMDAKTGTFLYSKNMQAKEYPASITKILTTLVALEHGDLDKRITISDWAVYSLETDSSSIGMTPGEKITLRQALYAVMLASANECANAVAEYIGGSQEGFAELMNQKAAELGCVNTHFVNAHGLHDENHYTCARDMAVIMQAALENAAFTEIFETKEYTIPKTRHTIDTRSFVNHQKMMMDGEFYYNGCLGGKTGFTNAALNTLVTVAKRNGEKLICVILRTNGPDKICWETEDLLDYGFKNFSRQQISVSDGQITRADVLEKNYLGELSKITPEILKEPMILTNKNAVVSLPNGADVSEVVRSMNGNQWKFSYYGWQVGSLEFQFNEILFEIPKLTRINPVIVTADTETETQVAVEAMEERTEKMQQIWNEMWNWLYAHDVAAALVILVLILMLIPILVVTYIRNRSSQRIRKQRQKEREERIRIERDIDNKSALEIEAELRAELEKGKIVQEKINSGKEQEEEDTEERKEEE